MEKDQIQSNSPCTAPEETSGAGAFVFMFPAVVSGLNKSVQQVKRAFYDGLENGGGVIGKKIDEACGTALVTAFPEGEYDPAAQVFLIRPSLMRNSGAVILASGRDDLPAALEARYALAACGFESTMIFSSGAADPAALADLQGRLSSAAACIAVAGTDTALPGMAAKMTQIPVIALPVSVPGSSPLAGLLSLAGILSCPGTGLAVVSTDDGIGAGFAAARMINSKTNQA